MGPIYGALASSLGGDAHDVVGRFHTFVQWLTPYLLLDPAPGGARDGFVREVSECGWMGYNQVFSLPPQKSDRAPLFSRPPLLSATASSNNRRTPSSASS